MRDYISLEGTIRAIRNFRMARFTPAGAVVRVEGGVVAKERREGCAIVEIELRTVADGVVTVGPGLAEVTPPERS
ncbi:hypothetical protein [Actinomadura chokoriensis]|uniref:Uncharacterized protein n=1 Tax=Actinomadura chokoriensis TaxID=454156 RepID=A0ABV4QS03_9ACTN